MYIALVQPKQRGRSRQDTLKTDVSLLSLCYSLNPMPAPFYHHLCHCVMCATSRDFPQAIAPSIPVLPPHIRKWGAENNNEQVWFPGCCNVHPISYKCCCNARIASNCIVGNWWRKHICFWSYVRYTSLVPTYMWRRSDPSSISLHDVINVSLSWEYVVYQ